MEGLEKLYEFLSQRFDKLEERQEERYSDITKSIHGLDKRIDRIETKNTLVSAAVAFLVVNFQNIVSFFKDKHH